MENDFSKITKQLNEHKTVQGIMKFVNKTTQETRKEQSNGNRQSNKTRI